MSFNGHHTYGYNNKLPDCHNHHHQPLPAADETVEISDSPSTSFVTPGYGYYQAPKTLATFNNDDMAMSGSSNGIVSQPAPGKGSVSHQRSNLPPASELLSLNGSSGENVAVVRGPPPDVRRYAMPQTPSNTLPSISSLGQKSSTQPYFYQQLPNYPQPSPSIPPSPYLNTPSTYYSITEPGTPAPQVFNQAEHSQVASPSMSVNFHSSNPPSLISSVPASPASSLSNMQRSPIMKRSNAPLTPDIQQQSQQTQQRQQLQQQSSAGAGFQQPYQHQEQRPYYQIEQQSQQQQLPHNQSVQLYKQYEQQQQEQLQEQQPTSDGNGSSITPSRNIRTPRTPKVTNKYRGGRTRNAALNSILQMHNTPSAASFSSSVATAGVSLASLASTSYIAGPAASFCDDGPTVKEHLQWQQARQRVLQYEAGAMGNNRTRRGKSSSASPHKAFIPPLSHNDGSGASSSPSSAASQPHYYVESSPAPSTSRQPTVYSQDAPTASYSAAAPPRALSSDIVIASAAAPQNTSEVLRRSTCKDSSESLQSTKSPLRVRDSFDDALASTIASVAAGEGGFNLETLLDPPGEGDEESLFVDEIIPNRLASISAAATRGRGARRSRRGSNSGGSGGTIGYFRGGSATTASGNKVSARGNALQAPSPSALLNFPSNEGFITMAEQNSQPDNSLKPFASRESKSAGGEQKPPVRRRRLNNASNQLSNPTDGSLILSDAVFQHPQQQQQQRGLSQEYLLEKQYPQIVPPPLRSNQLQTHQQQQQQHLSAASCGGAQAMRICVQNPPDALSGFPLTATTIHIVRQPSDRQTTQKDYTPPTYDGAGTANPPVMVAVSRQMQSSHLRYQQQPLVIRQLPNTSGNYAQTQQNGGVTGSLLVQNYTSHDQQQKTVYQQQPEQYPTYRTQQQPTYHEQHQTYQGQQRVHESQQQQRHHQHHQQQNEGHYEHYQQMHDDLYRMQQPQQTYYHQPSQQMVYGQSQLQQQYKMASGVSQASYTDASYPQQIPTSTGQLPHPSYYSTQASGAHVGTYLNGVRISTEMSDSPEVAAAKVQAEEDRKYSIKYHHLKRTCRAVVFKNAALADEVSRLRQRVQVVLDERWRLSKQLQHDRRNHIRRIQTKMRRWEAVRALQAANQQQQGEEGNSSEETITDSEVTPSGDEMALLEKPPNFDVENDDVTIVVKRPISRSDINPIRSKITNSNTKEVIARVSSRQNSHEETMESSLTKTFSSAGGDNSACMPSNFSMLLRRRDALTTSPPEDNGAPSVDSYVDVTPKSRLKSRMPASSDKTSDGQATPTSTLSSSERQKRDQSRLKIPQQQKRRVRLKKKEKSPNEADNIIRRCRRRQQLSYHEEEVDTVKPLRKQCSNQSAETIPGEKALVVHCSNGLAAPASFENGVSPRTRSATRRSLNAAKLESVEVDDFSPVPVKRKTSSLEKLSVVEVDVDKSFEKLTTKIIKSSVQTPESAWLTNSLEDSEEDANDNNNRKELCDEKDDKEEGWKEEKCVMRKTSAR